MKPKKVSQTELAFGMRRTVDADALSCLADRMPAIEMTHDNLWFCTDCMFAAVNGDAPESEDRGREVTRGLDNLAQLGHVVPHFDSESGEGMREHDMNRCDCCCTHLHGQRHRFGILSSDVHTRPTIRPGA